MTTFNIQINNHYPDVAFVKVDDRFDLGIVRTSEGLEIRVFPITDGEIWIDYVDTFTVSEAQIIGLEKEME